jgi:hypothetical protein
MTLSETVSETRLRRAARRSYELGRVEGALWRGALAALVAVPAYRMCGQSPLAGFFVGGLALVVAAGHVRGSVWAAGARTGALAGAAPCLLPAGLGAVNPSLCAATMAGIPWPCAVGGLVGGIVLGILGRRVQGAGAVPFWASATAALAFAAALGCLPAGALGFAGLVLGLLAGGAPALVAGRARG